MKRKERVESALLAAFPNLDSFDDFEGHGENAKILASLCSFAAKTGVIKHDKDSDLKAFIKKNALHREDCQPPASLDFENFFDQKEDLIGLELSTRALTDRINTFTEECRLNLPKVSNSMISRLKKETADTLHKQNVLRTIAFWFGYTHPHLTHQWNYEVLCVLCSRGTPSADHREGVRIGFSLFSRGEVIDHENVRWLKKIIKGYIEQSIRHFSYGRWGKVRSLDITTLYVDFPKETTVNTPEAYRHCLRGALSLCHQICIRWILSKHHSPRRFLSIGIAAGEYGLVDNHLLPILNAKLPSDPMIRLTDYARQCVLINDIRVLCCNEPLEMTLYNGETLNIWWIVGFWSTLYFDFVPDLLKDDHLSNNAFAIQRLARSLWAGKNRPENTKQINKQNAVFTFFKYPKNNLLGLEIAKTLYFRRRFWEAIEILRIVLSLDSTNIIARTLRMMILSDLSLDAPSYAISQGLFGKAHNEALFIQQNCAFQTEDFFCAHAMVYLAQAMLNLRYLREDNEFIEESDKGNIKDKIFEYLNLADTLFGMGDMVSSTGIRSYYLQKSIKVIKAVLMSNQAIFTNADSPIDGSLEIVRKPTREFKWQLGYFKEAPHIYPPGKLNARIFRSDYLSHEASIVLQASRPSFYFCSAVAWWDFLPVRTVANAKIALQLLYTAKEIAETLKKKNICTYSFTRTYGEMLTAEEFIKHMVRSIEMIKDQSGSELHRRKEDEIIEPKDPSRMSLLLTLNF